MSVNQTSNSAFREQTAQTWNGSWPLERILFAMAGTIILVSVPLAALVSPWFLVLTGFVGANQLLYAFAGFCGASLIITRLTGARPSSAGGAA